jgi:hypothetical membrane protein
VNVWQVAGNLGFLFMSTGLLLLGTAFLGFTHWRKTPTGRGTGTFFICTNAIIGLSAARLMGVLTPDSNWFWILRAAVFLVGGVAVLIVSIGFVRLQFIRRRSGSRDKGEIRLD